MREWELRKVNEEVEVGTNKVTFKRERVCCVL